MRCDSPSSREHRCNLHQNVLSQLESPSGRARCPGGTDGACPGGTSSPHNPEGGAAVPGCPPVSGAGTDTPCSALPGASRLLAPPRVEGALPGLTPECTNTGLSAHGGCCCCPSCSAGWVGADGWTHRAPQGQGFPSPASGASPGVLGEWAGSGTGRGQTALPAGLGHQGLLQSVTALPRV